MLDGLWGHRVLLAKEHGCVAADALLGRAKALMGTGRRGVRLSRQKCLWRSQGAKSGNIHGRGDKEEEDMRAPFCP